MPFGKKPIVNYIVKHQDAIAEFNKCIEAYYDSYLDYFLKPTNRGLLRIRKKLLDIHKQSKLLRKKMIVKLNVYETENLNASKCPVCGSPIEEQGTVKVCPKCGTAPFEKEPETSSKEVPSDTRVT